MSTLGLCSSKYTLSMTTLMQDFTNRDSIMAPSHDRMSATPPANLYLYLSLSLSICLFCFVFSLVS